MKGSSVDESAASLASELTDQDRGSPLENQWRRAAREWRELAIRNEDRATEANDRAEVAETEASRMRGELRDAHGALDANWVQHQRALTELRNAMLEAGARAVYEQWSGVDGWVPWVPGGNSLKQCDARRIVRKAFDATTSSAKPAVDDSSRDDLIPHPITAKGLS